MSGERRRFSRVPQAFDAQYRLMGELMESWRKIRTLNLSAGGMRFRSAALLEIGEWLEVQLTLPGIHEPTILRGRVVWSRMQASGVVENGMEFVDLSPEQQLQIDQLVEFLNKRP